MFAWLSRLRLSPAEPVSVRCGRSGGGDIREEEAVGSGGAGIYREWIQTGCRAQTLVSTGISCLFTVIHVQDVAFKIFPHLDLQAAPIPQSMAVSVLQLKPLPRTVALRTVYEARNWSYQLQHGAVWGSQEFSFSGLYSAPPTLDMGNQTLKGKTVALQSVKGAMSFHLRHIDDKQDVCLMADDGSTMSVSSL